MPLEPKGMQVVMVGNPVDGFHTVGPFKTACDATQWATDTLDGDWWLADLEHPEGFADGDES